MEVKHTDKNADCVVFPIRKQKLDQERKTRTGQCQANTKFHIYMYLLHCEDMEYNQHLRLPLIHKNHTSYCMVTFVALMSFIENNSLILAASEDLMKFVEGSYMKYVMKILLFRLFPYRQYGVGIVTRSKTTFSTCYIYSFMHCTLIHVCNVLTIAI